MGMKPSHPGSILLFLLMFGASSAFSSRSPANDAQAWQESGFSLETLLSVIPTESCQNSLIDFQACLAAVNTGLRIINPALELIPATQVAKVDYVASSDTTLFSTLSTGSLELVRLKRLEIAADQKEAFRKDDAKLRESLLKELLENPTAPATDFKHILTRLNEMFAKDKALSLGKMANAYLRARFDPHTRIELRSEFQAELDHSSVTSSFDEQSGVGYLKIEDFMDKKLVASTEAAIQGFQQKNAAGIVLDLRGNSGGAIERAIAVASLFIDQHDPNDSAARELLRISSKGFDFSLLPESFQDYVKQNPINQQTNFVFNAKAQRKMTDLPLVVLQDAGTASAAEVLIGILKYYNRAFTIGDVTYGKGILQAKTADINDQLIRFDTVGRYYFPDGSSPQAVGLKPDYSVYVNGKIANSAEASAIREKDLRGSIGPQGNAALMTSDQHNYAETIKSCVEQRQSPQSGDHQMMSGFDAIKCVQPLVPTFATI